MFAMVFPGFPVVFCQTPYVPFNWVSIVVDRQATEAMDNYSDGASPERKNLTDLTTGTAWNCCVLTHCCAKIP